MDLNNIAIAGIPNCGKTTLFNELTGSRQKVGNWPGVTVERVEGSMTFMGKKITLIDLPGTNNLSPDTEDQKIAERVIREQEHDLIINVVDASNLSRNLFLTKDLLARTPHVVVFLNMMDMAEQEGMRIDKAALAEELGVPVITVISVDKQSVKNAISVLEKQIRKDPEFLHNKQKASSFLDLSANDAYTRIDDICDKVITYSTKEKESLTDRIDKVVMNKYASVPIFFLSMLITFWLAIGVGSIFIDFFDILAGLIFVDIPSHLLGLIHAPDWLIVFLAGGVGAGVQTVATFIPVVFFMFLTIAVLEDIGYMARIGVVADRVMRSIGLPGSAFIPMVVGFGCTVPAVMAARTLGSKRDRYMTIFMAPFMSCGARLPVYALFCAALYGKSSGLVVFLIYLSGLLMAVFTGFLLKNSLFKGTPSYFIMDLPLYHTPKVSNILKSAWIRLQLFVRKAGVVVIIAVCILGVLSSMGFSDGKLSFGNENSQESVLAYSGKALSPIFEPMGVTRENWPASVALFTGLFAKEAIVGTVNALYSSMDMAESGEDRKIKEENLDMGAVVVEAFASMGEGFIGVFSSLDILGLGLVVEDKAVIAEEIESDTAVFRHISRNFTPMSAFAYLLFVLMYFPCLAVVGAARQEMGGFYTLILVTYTTLLAWSISTLFYQIVEGHNLVFALMATAILGLMYLALVLLGKRSHDIKVLSNRI
ncbi:MULTISPECIES: ferrous iron transport protein B [unclassified Oceanispirochaeta]|uniref:ferrous iron transport protein B n=1 Tax=unclassified Oceanispirochaeta TaxID=2635722 RepID=UPI000E09B1FC|nr:MULTISPECIES: ferrous iron transport protein B [unclassified Oceanispirochaeta]MBF9018713.1 ferrous iron transport protein B [Oceanispirochaeta sp. M2]NPD75151.1 ferrous iron transport protein B [Oceanispirochaeta sp. M1]RDG29003.1 ferrous iron transport protein B [Oceanispirochaeta sp. M1]